MTIFTYKKLLQAYMQCIKHKKNTSNALKFEMHREKNLSTLLHDLQTGRYTISRHICFIVIHPSPREIFAADFRDRVAHHLLCNEIQEIFEQDFSDNSYANRKGYGTHKAIKKVKWHTRRGGKDGRYLYFLKMDIKSFFRSIDKNILWNIVEEKIEKQDKPDWWKREVLWLARIIIFHNPASNYIFKGKPQTKLLIPEHKSLLFGDTSKGLPIGNLTSQFFANVYMNTLDHYIEHTLKYKRYARYVDDFILFDEDRGNLKRDMRSISLFCLRTLNLQIATHKTILRNTNTGIDFLGYYIKPTHTLVRRKVAKRFKWKFLRVLDENGFVLVESIPMIKSYVGHFKHANCSNLMRGFGVSL
jgi:RNA-directed DNA polymerase